MKAICWTLWGISYFPRYLWRRHAWKTAPFVKVVSSALAGPTLPPLNFGGVLGPLGTAGRVPQAQRGYTVIEVNGHPCLCTPKEQSLLNLQHAQFASQLSLSADRDGLLTEALRAASQRRRLGL